MSVAARTVRTVTWMNTTYTINNGRFECGGILGALKARFLPASG
ncbi:hypothetical protein [Rhizobium binae]|uniref:Uncharacterized protein n=1 Tax=Rhizobium binae TaxID=1138190 RepID=A0ABV2MLY1_9HYPH|nr:hypothetical protein [Rhizobium binae]